MRLNSISCDDSNSEKKCTKFKLRVIITILAVCSLAMLIQCSNTNSDLENTRGVKVAISPKGLFPKNDSPDSAYKVDVETQQNAELPTAQKKETNDPLLKAERLSKKGYQYNSSGLRKKAIESYKEALAIFETLPGTDNRVKIMSRLAELYKAKGNYKEASEQYINMLKMEKTLHEQGHREEIFWDPVAPVFDLRRVCEKWAAVEPENQDLKKAQAIVKKERFRRSLPAKFSKAVSALDFGMVRELLKKGADVNAWDRLGALPLERAAENGGMEMLKTLLDNGADLEAKNKHGYRAVDSAFTRAMYCGHENIARFLLDKGASIEALGPDPRVINAAPITALQCAISCSLDLVKLLVKKGADVNGRNATGTTPLIVAARKGKVDIVRFLLDKGANINAKDHSGNTALYVACDTMPTGRNSELDQQAIDRFEVVKLLINRGAEVEDKNMLMARASVSPLMRFARYRNVEGVKLLLEKGADANAASSSGANAIVFALSGGYRSQPTDLKSSMDHLYAGFRVNDPAMQTIKLLLTHGADVNARLWRDGSTPLVWVSAFGNMELVKLFIDKGADVKAKLKDGSTPLMCAITGKADNEITKQSKDWLKHKNRKTPFGGRDFSSKGNRKEVVRYLLDKGANPKLTLDDGTTPLMWAVILGKPEIVRILLERGADPNVSLTDKSTALMWAAIFGRPQVAKILLTHGADPNNKRDDGETSLNLATVHKHSNVLEILVNHGAEGSIVQLAIGNNKDAVKKLLDQGADVNTRGVDGRTALMECARLGHLDMVKLLLESGADPTITGENELNAFMEAIWNGEIEVARLLLRAGADPNLKDPFGWPPLTLAAHAGKLEAVSLLLNSGADIKQTDPFGKTAFMRAVEMGNEDVVLLLLEEGADINRATDDGWRPIEQATVNQDREMVSALSRRYCEMTLSAAALLGDDVKMRLIVEQAARKGAKLKDANMALLLAVRNNREDMVKFMLNKIPDIDMDSPSCDTALLLSIKNKSFAIAEALLKSGANPNAMNDWERTALHYAVRGNNIELVTKLIEMGANVNARPIGWDGTPLMTAVGSGNVEMVKIFIESGADFEGGVEHGDLMRRAREVGNKEILSILRHYQVKSMPETKSH